MDTQVPQKPHSFIALWVGDWTMGLIADLLVQRGGHWGHAGRVQLPPRSSLLCSCPPCHEQLSSARPPCLLRCVGACQPWTEIATGSEPNNLSSLELWLSGVVSQ